MRLRRLLRIAGACVFAMLSGLAPIRAQSDSPSGTGSSTGRSGSESVSGSEALRYAADQVREGNRLLDAGRFDEALAKYDAARSRMPEAPEIAYNRGLALYRLGRYGEAESAFQDAILPGNPELEARARYNLGRSAHAAALEKRENLPEAINELGRAIGFYNDAIQLAPQDTDAVRNREAAERLRAYFEKKLQAMQQEEQQDNKKDEQKQEENEDSRKDEQSQQPSSQPSDEQKQEQKNEQGEQQEQESAQDSEESQEQSSDQENQSQQNEQQGDSKSDTQKGNQQGEPSAESKETPSGEAQEHQLTAEEAEPMLQEARDAERQRREAKRMRMLRLRGRIPADKDW